MFRPPMVDPPRTHRFMYLVVTSCLLLAVARRQWDAVLLASVLLLSMPVVYRKG